MTFFRSLLEDLKEKRLWPVALALVVALLAVPVLLSDPAKESEEPSARGVGAALHGRESASLLGETKAVVRLGGEGGFRKRVGRLARKNPFVQQAEPKGAAGGGDEGLTVTGGATGASGAVPQGGPPTAPGGETAPGGSTGFFHYEAKVKFGRIGQAKSEKVEPADFMPSEQNPVLLFLGASDDGKKALFLVSPEAATARGDGSCVPSESDCQIVSLKKGDVEFFEVALSAETVVTYELELVEITLEQVSSESSSLERSLQLERLSTRRLRSLRQGMRTGRVFKALDQLGF